MQFSSAYMMSDLYDFDYDDFMMNESFSKDNQAMSANSNLDKTMFNIIICGGFNTKLQKRSCINYSKQKCENSHFND